MENTKPPRMHYFTSEEKNRLFNCIEVPCVTRQCLINLIMYNQGTLIKIANAEEMVNLTTPEFFKCNEIDSIVRVVDAIDAGHTHHPFTIDITGIESHGCVYYTPIPFEDIFEMIKSNEKDDKNG